MFCDMNITRQNYEEWLLLYVDNELSLAERLIVDDFLAANPDLQQELEMLQQSTFQPDEEIVFSNKASLLKSSGETLITEGNCEQYFVLYADDELSNQQKASVEEFVYRNPRFQAAFELILAAKLTPDYSIVFPNKRSLYRKEKGRRVVAMRWYKIAAAAVLVLLIGGVSYQMLTRKEEAAGIAGKQDEQKIPQPGIASHDSVSESPAVKDPSRQGIADNSISGESNNQRQNNQQAAAGKPAANDMATKNAGKGSARQLAPVVTPRVAPAENRVIPVVPDNEAFAAGEPSKINPANSNIHIPPIVTQTETAPKGSGQPKPEAINSPGKATLNNSDMAVIAIPSYDLQGEEEVEIQPANKKNRMRGILRKVSRVFEKATSADGEENRNIRIANFQIALK
jgi:hypothetical protein